MPASDATTLLQTRFAAPALQYLRADDNLRVTTYNALASVIVTVRARVLTADGTIEDVNDTQTPNTDRTAKTSITRTSAGWLLGGQVFVSSAAPLIGQTYVVVEIVRGESTAAIALQVLASGYVTSKQPLPFPMPMPESSLDGAGALRSISGTTPAAGAEISETVPTGARWELLAFAALLTTAVAAANRIVQLTLDDGAAVYGRFSNQQNQAASLAWNYSWGEGLPLLNSGGLLVVHGTLPVNNGLGSGHRIRTSTTAIQAADQWSAVQYLVREFLEGA